MSEVVYYPDIPREEPIMISKRAWMCYLAVGFLPACKTIPSVSMPSSSTSPTPPLETTQPHLSDSISRGPWTFAYSHGSVAYVVRRTATIQRTDSAISQDTVLKHTTSTTITHEALSFEPEAESTKITATIDSLAPVPSDSATQLNLHPRVLAVLVANTVTIDSSSLAVPCDRINSALMSDLRNLVIAFPDSLTPGLTWKDSINVQGCQSGIPTSSQVARSFLVKGETPIQDRIALQIVRSDSAYLTGEGGLQRHRVSIHGIGTGTATYYLDVTTGQLLRLDISQVLNVDIAALANKSQFQQRLEQEFLLSP
jgi:hypothetical protein